MGAPGVWGALGPTPPTLGPPGVGVDCRGGIPGPTGPGVPGRIKPG